VAELTAVHDGQSDEGKGHAEEIEEQRRGVLEGVFDEDEGGAPDEDDCEEQKVGYRAGAESLGQLLLCSRCLRCWCGVDGFAVDYGAEDPGVEELLV